MGAAAQGLFGSEPEIADRARVIAAIPEVTGELIRIGIGLGSVALSPVRPPIRRWRRERRPAGTRPYTTSRYRA